MENETVPARDKLFAALAKAQGEMKGAVKDNANPFFKSKYADLSSVWEACRHALSVNGLSVVQFPVSEGELVGVRTILGHASGQCIESVVWVPSPKKGPQELGSAVTYLRRYALAAAVGVAPEDDDGNGAQGRGAEGKAPIPGPTPGVSATPAAGKTAPTTKTAQPSPSADIKHDGTRATPKQITLLHTLKSKLGILPCDGSCAKETVKVTKTKGNVPITVRCVYHAQLAKFLDQAGKPITTSTALAEPQMSNLLERYFAQAAKMDVKTNGMRPMDLGAVIPIRPREPGGDDGPPEDMATPDDLADLETAAGNRWGDSYKECFPEWLKGAFDYDTVLELRRQEAIDACRMIRAGK